MSKKFVLTAILLIGIAFAIPIEHKYDKLFRFFSLTLIPQGLEISKGYDKKIYFYLSDLAALLLAGIGLFWFRIPLKRFFGHGLWIVFFCALGSILASPFVHYPIPYVRLWQLLTPILLFSFLAHAFSEEERGKITRMVLVAIVAAGVIQSGIAIAQYFVQGSIGLRLLKEPRFGPHLLESAGLTVRDGSRWIFDRIFHLVPRNSLLMRAHGTLNHPNALGGFMVLSLLASYPLIQVLKKWPRRLLSLSVPFQFFALSVSFSRSALFGWALGTLFFFLRKGGGKKLALLLLCSVAINALLLHQQYWERGGIVNYPEIAQGADQSRLSYQKTALSLIEQNPLLGVGYTQYPAANGITHNIYLYLATETGLISLCAFLLSLFLLFKNGLQIPSTPFTSSLLSMFVALLFIGCCDFYPLYSQEGKLMLFLIAGLLAAHTSFKRVEDPSRQEVWKMFDLISPTYDRINRILSLGMDQSWRKQVIPFLPQRKNLKILDLATGTGDQILALLKSPASIESVVGIDLSKEMLQIAKAKVGDKAQFLHANAEKLPFQNESFDAATFSFGIRNVGHPLSSLAEIHRVLKPKGRCLILEFSLPPKPIRSFFLFYLRHILPRIGGLLSRKPSAYRYLNQTIEHFPSGKDFCLLMSQAGFNRLKALPMALGGVTLYVGERT